MIKNNKVYDILKWISLVALDAFGVAYQEFAEVWNLPYGEQVFKSAVILSVLIGTLIGVSGMKYSKTVESTEYEEEMPCDIEAD